MKNTLPTHTTMLSYLTSFSAKRFFFTGKGFYGIFILPVLLFCSSLSAQIVLTSGQTADQYVEKIIGQGITYSNALIYGNTGQIASYTGGAGGGMQPTMNSGIVLSTGYVTNPTWLQGPAATFRSDATGGPQNLLELNALAGISATRDVIYLEFDFIPITDKLKINFQFGSEEYNEWVNTVFNDVFGFFISGPGFSGFPGPNIAWAPNGARVAVNAINRGTACPANATVDCNSDNPIGMGNCYSNPMYYIDNCSGTYDNAMDGFTVMLTAEADVIPCEEYHIRLALADGTDSIYDSWVFLQESGFYAAGAIVEGEVTHVDDTMDYVYEGCSGSQILFCLEEPLLQDHVIEILSVGGTATPFLDYLPLLPEYIIPAGETCVAIDIIALLDGINEGIETIEIEYQADVCNTATLVIEINDMPEMEVEFDIDDIEGCYDPANSFTLQPVVNDNVGTPIYHWEDQDGNFVGDEESITVNPDVTTTYTVTVLDACGTEDSASITITVLDDDSIPEFSVITTYCIDDIPDVLPLISNNNIEGVWVPDVIDTSALGTAIYTFTPNPGQCGVELELTVTVQEEIVPTFNPITSTICQGAFIPATAFPTTSTNNPPITGTWSPAPNNQATTTYTFTPDPNQCATEFQRTITVNPTVTPTFTGLPSVLCQGNNYTLPTVSNNATPISGTWSPVLANQQPNGIPVTYTFTPNAGQCSTLVSHSITINPTTTPTFNQVAPICAGDTLAPLPTVSNGVSGVWSPALNNQQTTTYTFTPFVNTTTCGVPVQMTIVVNQPEVPTFTLPTSVCAGTSVTLPTISDNGIAGTWDLAFDNQNTGTYEFTPNAGVCATPFTITINVNQPTVPTFNQINPICAGTNVTLPTTSTNAVQGTWSPAFNNQATTTYTFTPNTGQCATTQTMTVTVNQPVVPTFDPAGTYCSGDIIPPLPTTSTNGITGTWAPALNYTQTTTYTFTPSAGICATTQTMTITVTQPATPGFTQVAPICEGEPLADLPTTSINGVTGTWAPAIDNTQTTTYTFTPDAGQCTLGATMTIVVNPWVTPEFTINGICAGADSPLPNISNNGVTGTWSPTFDNTQTGTYEFTPNPGQCGLNVTVTVTVVGSVTTPVLDPLEYCDPNSDGYGIFDLTEVVPIIESVNTLVPVTVTFHETEDDANFNANNISMYNPLNAYPNGYPYNQTIYVRIANDSGCYAVIPLQLIVHDLPKITKNVPAVLEECEEDNGIAQFDLSESLPYIMNTLDLNLHTISYHPTENDARNNTAEISNYVNYDSASGSVWVRVEDNQTGCFDVVQLILTVNPLPIVDLPEVDRYVVCDDDDDGYAIFDLETQIAGIVNGQAGLTVTFHDTYADAESGASPFAYIHENGDTPVETVFVRVETEKGCYVITLMDLVVEPLPVLVPPTEPVTACDDDADGFGEVDFADTINQMLNNANPDDYVITIHETLDDAQLGENAIADIDNTVYANIGQSVQVVYLRVETIFGEGCFNIYPITINIFASPELPVEQDGTLPDIAVCDDNQDGITYFDFTGQTQYILDAQNNTANLVVTYHLNEQDALDGVMAISTVTNYQNIVPFQQTVWVRIENTVTECFDIAPFDLIVNLPLQLPVPPAITVCDEDMDGSVEFDLTIRIPDILANASNPNNFTVEFFTSYANAVAGNLSERIDNPESYWISTHVQTLGIRVTNNTTGCQSYTILDVRRAPMPNVPTVPLTAIEGCQVTHGSTTATFDLTERENFIRQGDLNLVITYHLTYEDAETGDNPITPADAYVSESATIYIRVANPPNGGTICARILEVELIVNPIPFVADNSFEVCEAGSTGYTQFFFPDFNPDLLGPNQDLNDFTIAYYHSEIEAQNQNGAISQTVPYTNTQHGAEPLWVRVTNIATGCFIIEQITLYAEEAAQATQPANNELFECDDWDGANDGFVTGIDLTVFESQILTGSHPYQIFYHTDEYEANQGVNAIANPANFTNTVSGGQTIWVRVENSNTTAPCYELVSLELIIEQPADPVITSDNPVLCVDWGATVANNAVVLDSGVSNTGYTFEWYHNGVLVAGETQSTLTLNNIGDEGIYTVIAISDNGCISQVSDEFEVILSGAPELVNYTTTNAFQDQQNIIVTVQGNGVYMYQLNDGPLQDTGYFTNIPAGTHTVTVYDVAAGDINQLNSCGNLIIDDIKLIDYPKFFTPNGDGYNEHWNITGLTEFHNAEIFIFDRYGKLLKQLNPTGDGWDGTLNGQQLPSTDYWFRVYYDEEDTNNNTQRKEFKAHFSLKR